MNIKVKNTKSLLIIVLAFLSINLFAADRYWVGGTGNWSNTAHWSTASGGASGFSVPTSSDNVFFDANSFTGAGQTVSITGTEACLNLDWTGAQFNPTFSLNGPLSIYGSLTFVPGMSTYLNNGDVNFKATTAGKTITMAGQSLQLVYFDGVGGEWTFQDAFTLTSNFNLTNGSINTNNQNISMNAFLSFNNNARQLNLGSSTVTGTHGGPWYVGGSNFNLLAGTSVLNFPNASASFIGGDYNYFDVNFTNAVGSGTLGGGLSFNKVIFSGYGYINTPNANISSVEFYKDANFQATTGANFDKALFHDLANIQASNTFDTLICAAGKTYQLYNGYTQTINNLLQINGSCLAVTTFKGYTWNASTQANLNSSSAQISVDFVSIKDVNASGGANFTANNSNDLGNNTGWTINAPTSQNFYWFGGTGNWNDVSHWSYSSGSLVSAGCLPTRHDNVFFDGNSFAAGGIVTVNAAAECKNMDWTGATANPTFSGSSALNIYGSLTFISGMTNSFAGITYFKSTSPSNTITSAGKSFNNEVHFDGANADWTLNDALSITGAAGDLYLDNGYLVTNDQTITARYFTSTGTNFRGLYLGNSIINITGVGTSNWAWNVTGSNFSVDAGTSTINLNAITSSTVFIGGAGNTYYNLNFNNIPGNFGRTFDGATYNNVTFNNTIGYINTTNSTYSKVTFTREAYILGPSTIDTLQLAGGYTCTFSNITTYNIKKIITPGTCAGLVTIQTSSPGSQGTINAVSPITVSYVALKDINRTGSSFTANNSQDLGNNTGITINAPSSINLYWVGGTGNWNDPAHWSLTQGGAGGACVPTSADNVFFTTGSFTAGSKTVTMNVAGNCKNMTWTNAPFSPTFTGSSDLNIYGSLTFTTTINFTWTGKTYFKATAAGNTITSAGKIFNNNVYFDGAGGWILQDAFSTGVNFMYLDKGTLNTNSKNVTTAVFTSSSLNLRSLILGSSIVNCGGGNSWDIGGSGLSVNAGTSKIILNNSSSFATFNGGVGLNYYDISFLGTGFSGRLTTYPGCSYHNAVFYGQGSYISGSGGSTIASADFKSNALIYCSTTFDSLLLSPGITMQITTGTTQTINTYLGAFGTAGSPITIQTDNSGVFATINKNGCNVCTDYLTIRDIHTSGTASFYAANSTNNGNNTGWNFAACPSTTLTVGPISGPANACVNGTNYIYSIPAVSGGTYTWNVPSDATILSGQGTNTIYVSFGSTGGNVSVSVTACGNTASDVKAVTVNPNPTITNISVTPATCSNADGSATATVTGGTPTYYYRWSSADTLATAPALAAGQYQLLVFDIYGCRAIANTTIVASDGPQISVVSTTPTSCNGGANATASISVTGGTTPYVILWSNGASTLSTTGLAAGPYEVTVTDANECGASQSITITQPTAMTNSFTISPSACAGSTGSAQANVTGGTGAYTYAWDGAAANQTTQLASNLAAGVYQVIVTDANLCQTTFNATVPNTATTLASSISGVVAGDCGPNSAGSATLDATGGAGSYTYLWSNNATTATITGVTPGNYYCTVTDASLCSSSQSVTIPSSVGNITQAICMVTVDTSTFTNQVIWEKLITNDIQSFKIYRESNITNVYTNIATIPFTAISEYTDPVANPAIHAWRYKITAVDSCGVETPYSAPHKTIHLAQNLGVGGEINLSWDQYEGFPYFSYYIWRHDPSTGWQPLDTLSTNYTTYTDFVPPSSDSRYMIEVRPQAGCTSTLRLAGGNDIQTVVVKSKSNIKNNRTVGIKSDVKNVTTKIKVYPNPANDLLNVEVSLQNEKQATISIENMLGQVVYTIQTNKPINSINTSNLTTGVYFVKVSSGNGVAVEKVIVE